MSDLQQVRQTCADAILRCEQVEQKTKQRQESAVRQRQAALTEVRQKHAQASQQVETKLKEVRSLVQQGDRILADLGLAPGQIATSAPSPSGGTLAELARLLQNQRVQAREALAKLKTTAKQLEEERRKWWKFW